MDQMREILVINPNSSVAITDQIREAVTLIDDDVSVVASPRGPAAIESDDDVLAAVQPMLDTAREHHPAAYVVACFSDPGLEDLRAVTATPTFGIAESAVTKALELGSNIGVISSVAESVPRHGRYWRKLGMSDSVVADIPLGIGVLELDTEEAYEAALAAGRQLVERGADVVILGCAGMTHMENRLEEQLGVPVIDPCRAAVEQARRAVGDR